MPPGSEPLAPPGMPPISFSAPSGGGDRRPSQPGWQPTADKGEPFDDASQEDMRLRLELGPMRADATWDDESFVADAEVDDCCPPAAYGRPLPLQRQLSDSFSVSRGPTGKLRSLNMSFGTTAPSDKVQAQLEETQSAPRSVHGGHFTWVRGEVIGRGSLGVVCKALDQNTGRIFAAKEILVNDSDAEDRLFKEALQNEIDICKDLQHPRIVSYLGHDSIDNCLYVYLEYMPGGSLASVLAQFGTLDECLVALYTQELLEGLEYLHSRDPPVVHRDIKGANVLVGLDSQVKLADFGCSKRTTDTMSHTMKGSIPWMAPEVIKNTGYGRAADVWSLGCVVLEMCSEARSPWGKKFDNPMAAMFKIAMSTDLPPVPEAMSDACKDFLRCCISRDPAARHTAKQLLLHEFVQDLLIFD